MRLKKPCKDPHIWKHSTWEKMGYFKPVPKTRFEIWLEYKLTIWMDKLLRKSQQ